MQVLNATIAQDAVDSLWCSECNAEYAFFCLIGMTKWTLRLVKWEQNHLCICSYIPQIPLISSLKLQCMPCILEQHSPSEFEAISMFLQKKKIENQILLMVHSVEYTH